MNKTTYRFVYTNEELKEYKYRDFERPYDIYMTEGDDTILAVYSIGQMGSCTPVLRYKGLLWGAGLIQPTSGSYMLREYYKMNELPEEVEDRIIYDMDVRKSELIVNKSDTGGILSLEVMVMLPGLKPAILNAARVNHCWNITRVNVPEKYRKMGVGSRMMVRALHEMKHTGCCEISVNPGGYDMEESDQVNFYARHRFLKTGEGTMKYFFT